ncbi:hypothetical protein ACKKBG_A23855 [Auxenochlorella protothecoides x Auxenochlorella symbiontica]
MQHHIQSPRSEGIREGKILTGRPPCRIQVFRHGVHVRIGVRSRSSVRHPAYSCIQRSSPDPGAEGSNLASQFDRHVLDKGWTAMPRRTPSPLLSPGAVISAQLEALQRNDWPEEGAGVATAFAFTLPASATEAGALDSTGAVAVSRWSGERSFVPRPAFEELVRAPPFSVLLGCDSWKVASPVVFPSSRHSDRAVQAVHVQAAGTGRTHTFTFCLVRAGPGSHKDCWMTSRVLMGDYGNV